MHSFGRVPKMSPNEVYDDRLRICNDCEPTCERPRPYLCYKMACGRISCTCADGFVRNKENNKCIPLKECPNPGPITYFEEIFCGPFDVTMFDPNTLNPVPVVSPPGHFAPTGGFCHNFLLEHSRMMRNGSN
ncbi:trypsin inhibitor like cysteine rich domain-containing protein [Ditylenchus destructor]|uniref:Trypsin inhibitor like cysteine rich domain-containing protein n=1 Tax=Ditylenchus destructor TaxID=166010 RepID=A0AAD4MR69_9BILA|nr:trypsin inhibitor like cysteine rich domain-containing protein [Ditylenchus destructor]